MYKINCDSDFKIIEGFKDNSSISSSPFKFTYYTRPNREVLEAFYDGINTSNNCRLTEDNKLIVAFDDHQLGTGRLKVRREFYLDDADFQSGICDLVTDEELDIILEKGIKSDCIEVNSEIQTYYHITGFENSEDFERDKNGKFIISQKFKDSKQDKLISGNNIKTINNESLLGSGNITIQGGGIPEVIDKEIYYNDGSNEVVPVKWPDLSTQPSILPYKFMGQYVYEQLIPYRGGYFLRIDTNDLIGTNQIILEACLFGTYGYLTSRVYRDYDNANIFIVDVMSVIGSNDSPAYYQYYRIVYTSSMPEEGGDYYGYNNY